MEVCTRQRCHAAAASASSAMGFAWLLMAMMIANASSMLFRTRADTESCVPRLSRASVRELSSGMSNMTYMYNHLLRHILVERVPGSEGNAMVREFIKREMQSLGWRVDEDTFEDSTPFGPVLFSNIIATFNPAAVKRVVVACHYDSKYMPGSQVPFIAATDSAVPCSLMIDTARKLNDLAHIAQDNSLSDFSLQFIFFDGEESFVRWTPTDSTYGSRHLAWLWEHSMDNNDPGAVNNLENIQFFTLLDLIGNYRTRFVNYYSNTSQLFYSLHNIEQCLKSKNLLVSTRHRPPIFDIRGQTELVEDDHTPFIQRGVPVLHLISTPFPQVWHTIHDNARNLNSDLIQDFARIFRIFLASLLAGPS